MGNRFSKAANSLREFRSTHKKLLAGIGCSAALVAAGILFGVHEFAVREIEGIDVSHFQGNISWRAVREDKNIRFAYMKATEGKSYQDAMFQTNWKNARAHGLIVGAYHFYSASSTGSEQAKNFIAAVPKSAGTLPPAIDIESNAITEQKDFKTQLAEYIRQVTQYYGKKPVFYVSRTAYDLIYDDYPGYSFWVIASKGAPGVSGWTFWQYSDKATVGGIDGKVDLDRYRGSLWDFHTLVK